MNYLFVGTAECTRRIENKKRKKGKGRKNLRWRRKGRRNMYRRVLQRLLGAFILFQLDGRSSLQKEEQRKRDRDRMRERWKK